MGNFNGEKREPIYATNGSTPGAWEASMLLHHFHPSVKAFTNSWVISPEHLITFNGDPIAEFNISSFLNRFSYKNPKKRNMDKVHRPLPKPEEPINSLFSDEMAPQIVAPDKAFFHKYFGDRVRLVSEGKLKNRSKQKADDENMSDVDYDEAEIDKFADTLAENLMKSAAGGAAIDLDDDSIEDDDVDDADADAVENNVFSADEDEFDAEDGELVGKVDGDPEFGIDFDEEEDIAFEEEEKISRKRKNKQQKDGNRKSKKSKHHEDDDEFADADGYEVEMEDIIQKVLLTTNGNKSQTEPEIDSIKKKLKKNNNKR